MVINPLGGACRRQKTYGDYPFDANAEIKLLTMFGIPLFVLY